MKYRLLDILKCDCGRTGLWLDKPSTDNASSPSIGEVKCRHFCGSRGKPVVEAGVKAQDCEKCYGIEIKSGELCCECGKKYPIEGGIPRFIPDSLRSDFKQIQETFSYEWKMFRFGQRNWGQDIEYRKSLFLQGMDVGSPGELEGKLILDAGCGSGLLSMEMANSFKMEVVALDLAFGIENAYRKNSNPFVHFVQGSVLDLPFRPRHFDLLYCAGVLVALPDTHEGFLSIKQVLKDGGRCFIWVYHPIDSKYHPDDRRKMQIYNWVRENVTSRLPIKAQYYLYLSTMPAFLLKQNIDILVGKKHERFTIFEKMQALFDMFSPIYQNRHTFEEVVNWFEKSEFGNIKVSDIGPYGFGTKGDLRSSRAGNGRS